MSESPEIPDRWTAVVNPAAGRRRSRARVPQVVHALGDADLDVTVHVTTDADDLRATTCAAFDSGRGVIACGGDGTVCAVAGPAAERGGVLAVVPMGSGNDLARHLDIPRGDPALAIRAIESGRLAQVDLGRAISADDSSAWFTTVANTGFDAEANRWANTLDWITGAPLYVLAVLRTLVSYRPHRARITIDGTTTETDAWLVAIGNTRSYAGGMVITPDASMHDGLLDVCVVGPVSPGEFLRTFPSVFRGAHVRHPLVTMYRGSAIEVVALDDRAPPLELWASGERVGPLPARVTSAAGALRVVVP